ncbi:MAG: DUF2892 domain-containing protein [Anaerolineae bacterium]|nr:DUF2892 domain-containing protein [Anaerolineae bacterium]
MNAFVNFMASTTGRIVRIVAGLALIVVGLALVGGTTGIIVAVIGAVPLLAGVFDFCIFAPLFGRPLSGPKIRAGQS